MKKFDILGEKVQNELVESAKKFNELESFINAVGWASWMEELTENEEPSESELEEINEVLESAFDVAHFEIAALKADRLTEAEAIKSLEKGTQVIKLEDAPNYIESISYAMDQEENEALKAFVEAGKIGRCKDSSIVVVNDTKYYIEYVL